MRDIVESIRAIETNAVACGYKITLNAAPKKWKVTLEALRDNRSFLGESTQPVYGSKNNQTMYWEALLQAYKMMQEYEARLVP